MPETSLLPPHDLDAEDSVVAALMVDNEAMLAIAGIVNPDDFYRETDGLIFAAQAALYARNVPINPITVGNELAQRGTLESIGGLAHLTQLTTDLPTAVGAEWYARIVARDALYRRAVGEFHGLMNQALLGGVDPEILLSNIALASRRIAGNALADDVTTVAEITARKWEAFAAGLYDRAKLRGIPTGFASLDHFLTGRGILLRKLYVVGGQTSTGKSTWLRIVLRNMALAGHHVCLFSLEQDEDEVWEELVYGLAAYDHAYHESTGAPPDRTEELALERTRNTLALLDNFHVVTTAGLTAAQVHLRVARLASEVPLAVFGVDYLHRMRFESDKRNRRGDEELAESVGRLADTAKECDAAVILMSQLNRANLDQRERKSSEFRPRIGDFHGTSALEKYAYAVIALHRRAYYVAQRALEPGPDDDVLEACVLKQQRGRTGTARLRFDGALSSIEDLNG